MKNISKQFERKGKNPGGGTHPHLGIFGWRNTLGVWGLIIGSYCGRACHSKGMLSVTNNSPTPWSGNLELKEPDNFSGKFEDEIQKLENSMIQYNSILSWHTINYMRISEYVLGSFVWMLAI